MPRVVIVDDHPVSRDGLAIRIDREPDLEVCGEAADIADAVLVIESTKPDIAIIDVSLETGNGIELVKEVKTHFPQVRMLVWSMYDESLYARRAIQAGALGYINKKNVRDKIIEAIRTVLNGNVYLSPEFSSKLIDRMAKTDGATIQMPSDALTDRELEAFSLIGQGLKTTEIAKRMELTQSTVETYRSRIKEKLQLEHAAELVREATCWVLSNS